MEKKQYKLCIEIFRRFYRAGILKDFILIGSWCVYFYKDYFINVPYIDKTTLRTRDIDFLIDNPDNIKNTVDIPELLKDLGFVTIFKGREGYIKLDHPDLILEFLVPEKVKGLNKPYSLSKLEINAVALRFLNFLSSNTIRVMMEDFYVTLPHPANFALHKLVIFQRRAKEEKAIKDRNSAIDIIKALINRNDIEILRKVFNSVPQKWQKKITRGIEITGENKILEIFSN